MLYLSLNTLPAPYIYTLSLHDALPILDERAAAEARADHRLEAAEAPGVEQPVQALARVPQRGPVRAVRHLELRRSEEHTSELQSHSDIVCRLLLEKKKNKKYTKETQEK